MAHLCIVECHPFGSATRRRNTPDVHSPKRALDEIEECRIRRPNRKVTVQSGWGGEYRPLGGPATCIRNKQWIARTWRVVSKPRAVGRPVELGHAFQIRRQLSAYSRRRPNADTAIRRAALFSNPKRDERAIGRKP